MKRIFARVWLEFICKKCKAAFEAFPEDVRGFANIRNNQRPGHWIPVVICGNCEEPHKIPKKKITRKIQNLATTQGNGWWAEWKAGRG